MNEVEDGSSVHKCLYEVSLMEYGKCEKFRDIVQTMHKQSGVYHVDVFVFCE